MYYKLLLVIHAVRLKMAASVRDSQRVCPPTSSVSCRLWETWAFIIIAAVIIGLMMMLLMGRVFRACCVRCYDSKKTETHTTQNQY
jgi:hypothetical protein